MTPLEFFRRAVADAMTDPCYPCANRLHAACWVLLHYRWLRGLYAAMDTSYEAVIAYCATQEM